MKKFLCVLLIIAMVAVPFVACNDKKGPGTESGNGGGNETFGEDKSEELELPANTNYGGAAFNIMYEQSERWGYFPMDFDDPPTDDFYAVALHKRNLAVEEKLGVEIVGKQFTDANSIATAFSNDVVGDNNEFHACFCSLGSFFPQVTSGNVVSFDQLPWVKLDKAWWNKDCNEQLSIAGKSYLNAGDIMISDKEVIWAMYFIKSRIADKGLENPYELVKNNKWTWDKMYEMAYDVHSDANSNDVMEINSNDVFGLCTHKENYAASWESAGLRAFTPDSSGVPQATWGSETWINVWEEADEEMTNDMVVSNTNIDYITTAIMKNQTLFGTEVIAFVRTYRNSDNPFGILPYPKYTSDVDRYYSYVAINSACVGVGYTNPNTDYISVVLETMAAYGRRDVLPVYYEQQLKSRFSTDEESGEMLDIIFEYRCYDLGIYIDSQISGLKSLTGNEAVPNSNPSRTWQNSKSMITANLENMLQKLLSRG